jgi:hypothetical protein
MNTFNKLSLSVKSFSFRERLPAGGAMLCLTVVGMFGPGFLRFPAGIAAGATMLTLLGTERDRPSRHLMGIAIGFTLASLLHRFFLRLVNGSW